MNNYRVLREVRGQIRDYISPRPLLWKSTCYLRCATFNMMDSSTVLACEGYPRSANSFAEAALILTQGNIRIAHHRHVPAQLMIAIKLGKPALLLIRNPRDAVASVLLRANGETTAAREIASWIAFHRACLPIRAEMTISDFPVTIGSFSRVLDALSERSGGSIRTTSLNDDELSRQAYELISRISAQRGSDSKLNYGGALSAKEKQAREQRLAGLKAMLDHEHRERLAEATALYEQLREASVAPR